MASKPVLLDEDTHSKLKAIRNGLREQGLDASLTGITRVLINQMFDGKLEINGNKFGPFKLPENGEEIKDSEFA